MPFTLSHAVLAPVISKLSRNQLPIAALAIGCMVPDLSRLISAKSTSGYLAHLWSSLLYPNLLLGFGFCALWYVLYRPVIYELLEIDDPLDLYHFFAWLKFIMAIGFALILGNATHLFWDGMTHVDFRTLFGHEFLKQSVSLLGFTYPLHFVLQITSSAVTLPILLWMCHSYLQQHRCILKTPIKYKKMIFIITAFSVLMGAISTGHYLLQFSMPYLLNEPYYFIGRSFNEFTQGFLLTSSLGFGLCLLSRSFFFTQNER